jgi:hypothetical protein
VVVVVYLAGRLVYKLREILLLMVVAGFIALLLNPAVVALRRVGIKRRGSAVAIVTAIAVLIFAGLAFAFGYPLVNAITHLARNLPTYVHQAENGKGPIGHLLRKYHVENWVKKNLAPKLASFAKDLSKPALTVGKGAVTILFALFTIFVLVLLLLLEGHKLRGGLLRSMVPARAERASRIAAEVSRSVTGYMFGNLITSIIAGTVVFVALLSVGVPFALLGALGGPGRFPADDRRGAGWDPDGALRLRALLHGRRRGADRVPRLHPDREPRLEPGHPQPDRAHQPAAGAGRDPGRGERGRLHRRVLRRLRGHAARDPPRRLPPGARPRALAHDGARAGRRRAGDAAQDRPAAGAERGRPTVNPTR